MHISGEIARYWKRLTPILYLVKHQRLSKHYMCLLTAKLVESSRI